MAIVRAVRRMTNRAYGFGAVPGDPCTTAAGQPGNVQEWYDADMGMVVGMICTTDPPGTRIYRHSTSPATSYSDPYQVTPPAPPPVVSPFAAGRVPGGACQVNGVMGVFNSALECVIGGGGVPASAPSGIPTMGPAAAPAIPGASPSGGPGAVNSSAYDPASAGGGSGEPMPTGTHDDVAPSGGAGWVPWVVGGLAAFALLGGGLGGRRRR